MARKRNRATRVVGVGLTPKQRIFSLEYLANGGNGTEAARAAGYSPECAAQQAHENLAKPAVRAFIDERMRPSVLRLGLRSVRLDEELAAICYVDPARIIDPETGTVLPLDRMPEDVRRAVRSVKIREVWSQGTKDRPPEQIGRVVEIKFEPKVEAIGLAYRRLGLLQDKLEVSLSHEQLLVLAAKVRERKLAARAGATSRGR